MYPELKQFVEMSEEYEEKIKAATQKWNKLNKQKENASKEYEDLLNEYGRRNSKIGREELQESRDVFLRYLSKEREALEELDALKESKNDRMDEFVRTLNEARDREVEAATRHMRKKINELERMKAEYFMIVQQLHQIQQYVNSIEEDTKKAVESLGRRYERGRSTSIYPAISKVEIPHRELIQVFEQGELPLYLRRYVNGGK
ncbi:hypothetical protein WD019_13530 [Fictibacillus sp. Mic-4]|uniref:hypothetical protein n=1 Tax=Fictibacillus TaxID=1329200 RepID=UPI0004009006|nr:hypothetical protein [Fictibacillus gelatini]